MRRRDHYTRPYGRSFLSSKRTPVRQTGQTQFSFNYGAVAPCRYILESLVGLVKSIERSLSCFPVPCRVLYPYILMQVGPRYLYSLSGIHIKPVIGGLVSFTYPPLKVRQKISKLFVGDDIFAPAHLPHPAVSIEPLPLGELNINGGIHLLRAQRGVYRTHLLPLV